MALLLRWLIFSVFRKHAGAEVIMDVDEGAGFLRIRE